MRWWFALVGVLGMACGESKRTFPSTPGDLGEAGGSVAPESGEGGDDALGVAGVGGQGGSGGQPVAGAAGGGGYPSAGTAGTAGVTGPPDPCPPQIVSIALPEWEASNEKPTSEEKFAAVVAGIVGDWQGVVTTPWTDPYEVRLSFTEDGHYDSRCLHQSNSCCIAFYYGTDDPTDLKRYEIEDATLSGNVTGRIDIPFGAAGSYSLPGWDGELSSVDIDASGARARFDFNRNDGYGPVHFELGRLND